MEQGMRWQPAMCVPLGKPIRDRGVDGGKVARAAGMHQLLGVWWLHQQLNMRTARIVPVTGITAGSNQ